MAYLKNLTDNFFQIFFMGTSWVAVSINNIKTRNFFEILIKNGAFWINLDHQLRAEISPIFSNIFTALLQLTLVIENVFLHRRGDKGPGGGSPLDPPLNSVCQKNGTLIFVTLGDIAAPGVS